MRILCATCCRMCRSPWPHPRMRAVFPLSPLLFFVHRLVASALQMPTSAAYGFGLQCGRAFALALPRVLFFGAAWRQRAPGVTCITWAWQPTALRRPCDENRPWKSTDYTYLCRPLLKD